MFFTLLLTAIHIFGAVAQDSTVVCSSNYTWAENKFSQSPCVVASYLQGVCTGGGFNVQALPPDTHYAPPLVNNCECNTVVYSLISACADCQGSFYLTWADWAVNCTSIYVSTFPEPIPVGTAVPAWAYLDVVSAGIYNPLAAEADLGAESTASTPRVASTSPLGLTATSFGITTPTTASSANPTSAAGSAGSSKKKTSVGAIAGGVVGGLAVLALVAGAVLFFVMRGRSSRTPPSAAYLDSKAPLATPPPMAQYPPNGAFGAQQSEYAGSLAPPSTMSPPPGSQHSADPLLQQSLPRPYDPSDPSTFPTDTGYPQPGLQGYPSQPGPQGYPSQPVVPQPGYPSQPGSQGYPSSMGYGSQTSSPFPQYRGTPQV